LNDRKTTKTEKTEEEGKKMGSSKENRVFKGNQTISGNREPRGALGRKGEHK